MVRWESRRKGNHGAKSLKKEHVLAYHRRGKNMSFFPLQFYFPAFSHVEGTWDTFLEQLNRKIYFWSLNLYWHCISYICIFAGMSVWNNSKVILNSCLCYDWFLFFPLWHWWLAEERCRLKVLTSIDCNAYWLGKNLGKMIWKYINSYLPFRKTVQWEDKLQLLNEWKQFIKTQHKNSSNNKSDQASAELWARGKWSQCTSWRIWLFKVWKLLVI